MNAKKQSRREYIIQEALHYAAMNFSVMPLGTISKNSKGAKIIKYLGPWKIFQTQRATAEDIGNWSATNLGIVTGPISNLLVLDLDSYKQGYDRELEKSLNLPITPTVQTASGGKQLYFKWPKGIEIRNDVCIGHQGSGIDVRAAGGMVIAPPSSTPYGEYIWLIDPLGTDLADVPPKLLELLRKEGSQAEVKIKRKLPDLMSLAEGEGRNNAMASLVGTLIQTISPDLWEDEVWPSVQAVNNTYRPPLDLTELRNVYESITKSEIKQREKISGTGPRQSKAASKDMSPRGILERLVAKNAKTRKTDKIRLMIFPFIFLEENPHLKVTSEGQFYDYADGVYRTQADLEMRNRVLRSLTAANLGDIASPQATAKIFNLLRANAPRMPESDVDTNILNLKNGLLDLRSMILSPHTADYVSTSQSPASFISGAPCEKWQKFLEEVTKSDRELIDYLQEVVGYCALTNDTSHHAAFFIYGPGGNGKGTFTRTISSLVDPNLLYHASVEQITGRFGGAMMIDKRLLILDEPNIKEFKSEIFRKYVSGEPSFAEKKGVTEMISFVPRARFICTTNEPPRYDEANDANSRRFHLIPFTNKFEGEKLIRNLADSMIAEERDGILLWAIEGLKRLQIRGQFSRPEIVRREQKIIGRHNSSVRAFFDENFVVTKIQELCVEMNKDEMYWLYKIFCARDGYRPKASPRFVHDMKLMPSIEYRSSDDRVVAFTNLMPLEPFKKLQELKESYTNLREMSAIWNQ